MASTNRAQQLEVLIQFRDQAFGSIVIDLPKLRRTINTELRALSMQARTIAEQYEKKPRSDRAVADQSAACAKYVCERINYISRELVW
jgi:hypothetical protein